MDQTKINEQIKSIVNKDRQIRSYFAGMAQALRFLIKSNQIKSNQIKSNQIKSNQIKSQRAGMRG